MKTFNHSSSFWLAVALALLATVCPGLSATRQFTLPQYLGKPGSVVQVPLQVDNAAGLAAVQVRINFNPQLLTLNSVTLGQLGTAFELDYSAIDGVALFLLTRETALLSGSGRLLVLHFGVNPGAPEDSFSEVTLAEVRCNDASGVLDLSAVDQMVTTSGRIVVSLSETIDNDGDSLPDYWEALHGLSMLDPSGLLDLDGDSRINLFEYAFCMNPAAAGDEDREPALGSVTIGDHSYLTLTFRRQNNAADVLNYAVEESRNLANWMPVDAVANLIGTPVDHGDGTHSITVRGTLPKSGSGAEPKAYLRVRVTGE